MAKTQQKDRLTIPFLPLRGTLVFPHTVMHIDVARSKSVASVYAAMETNQRIFLVMQKNEEVEDPTLKDLYRAGTIATISQVLHHSGAGLRVLIEGESRALLKRIKKRDESWMAEVQPLLPADDPEDQDEPGDDSKKKGKG